MKKSTTKKEIVLFEEKEVRRLWKDEQWYMSIIDIVGILSQSLNPRRYWSDLKRKLVTEGYSELYENIVQLKMQSSDGKMYDTDASDLKGIFRIIQSIPSPKAEPFKLWLAKVGQERIEEIQDPERAIIRAKNIYEGKGYDQDWIAKRMRGINVRNTLTDEWQERGTKEGMEFAILTNEIYKGTFDMTAKGIKNYKNLGNPDNPRDHMTELELILTMLGEASTTELSKKELPKDFKENKVVARKGGTVAGKARKELETQLGKKVLSKDNFLSKTQKKLKPNV
jgi:DNA-damage-inducible protein D